MTSATSQVEPQATHHETIREQAEQLLHDFSSELKEEMDEMRHGELPAQGPEADLFVRRHVMGLILILFGLVALLLLIGVAAVVMYGPHAAHLPGMFLANGL